MKTYLTKAELKLMEVIWEKGQIPSNKLVKECLERFNWKGIFFKFITAICPFVYQRKKSDKRRYSRIGESNRRI